jgi:hypothetical protein
MLKIQQRKNSDRWSDYAAAADIDEAKEIIREAVEKSDITDYRVIEVKLTCKQEIVFVEPEDSEPEEEQPESEEKLQETRINHSDKENELLLDFLQKTIEFRRFPKVNELDEDPDMYSYNTYYNLLGSKSNICDMVISKITVDTIDKEFEEVLYRYCEDCEGPLDCDKNPTDCLLEEIKMGKVEKANYGDNNEKN